MTENIENIENTESTAKPVERRKGQRWRHRNNAGRVSEWILTRGDSRGWDCISAKNGNAGFIQNACWDMGMMTLIADAPADPSGAGEAACTCRSARGPLCAFCQEARDQDAKAPPAQEAPKAFVVCSGGCGFGAMVESPPLAIVTCPSCSAKARTASLPAVSGWPSAIKMPTIEEYTNWIDLLKLKAAPAGPCDNCGEVKGVELFRFADLTRAFCQSCRIEAAVWAAAQTGRPYTGLSRRPRPALAVDEGVESDCWPEGGR